MVTVATGLTVPEAAAKGKSIVQGTAAASFRVTQEGKPLGFGAVSGFLNRTFRQGRGGFAVQKSSFRISSAGEKEEITKKGLFSIKRMMRR